MEDLEIRYKKIERGMQTTGWGKGVVGGAVEKKDLEGKGERREKRRER